MPTAIDWRVSRSRQDEQTRGTEESSTHQSSIQNPQSKNPKPLVEATGWVTNAQGQVELVANVLNAKSDNLWYKPATCGDTSRSGI